ncbi:MAG TPA: DUF5916 domain-containing protein [Thermoanaerobaculia bacterium]|nr:DUF5916 domain-containing protein [Thermoanaerobaculia bacterium]
MHRKLTLAATILLILAPIASAQDTKSRPSYQAVRASKAPIIDGDLGDPAWESAPEITGFTQRDPDEGKPATQQTRIKVVYDDDAIYFGAVMEDDSKVTPLLARRDTDLNNGDYIRISIDSQQDRLNGAAFVINASNVQMDMILYNDIYDDISWDAVWDSAVKIGEKGWVAEVRIPYSQLRFPDKPVHAWGVNISRWQARLRESSRLVHTPKSESGFVSRFADLNGIEGIRPKRRFEIVPYAVARNDFHSKYDNPFIAGSAQKMDAGVDVKYGLTSSLTLTGTINPDFGQVEVDPAVLNLSQFETFFPEKRPFFTEGADVFRFGNGPANSRWGFNMWFPTFFYSRRIGRQPQGFVDPTYVQAEEAISSIDFTNAPGETTILGAAKISGKIGRKWTVGLLDAVTDEERAFFRAGNFVGQQTVEPMTNYLVARAMREYGKDSRVGFMFTSTNRKLTDNLEPAMREDAYFAGVDGHTLFRDKTWILEWLGGSSLINGSESSILSAQRNPARYYQRPDAGHVELDSARTSLDGWMGRVMFAKQKGKWRPNIQVQALSPGFELNDVGFLPRVDAISTHAVLHYLNTDQTKFTREISMWGGKFQNWNFDGDMTANGVSSNAFIQFRNYWYVASWMGARVDAIDDQKTRGGPLAISAGNYFTGAEAGTDSRKKLSFYTWGERVDTDEGGGGNWLGAGVTYRPSPAIRLSLNPSYGRSRTVTQYVTRIIDGTYAPTFGDRYVFATIEQRTFEMGIRTEWTMSSRLSLQLYLQPFVASGDYHDFKQLARARDDEYTPVAAPFDPDFNFRSVRGSAVMRWEFRPGSALYVVWNENREDFEQVGDFRPRRDFSALRDAQSKDVFLVKFSYWLPV